MKTKKIIEDCDKLLKEINQKNSREKKIESLEFELGLVDELLKEIKNENLEEGIGDFFSKLLSGFMDFLSAGLKEVLGVNDEKVNSSRSAAFKAAKKEPGELKPDKSADDLIIWAISMGFVTNNLEKAKERVMASQEIETPTVDPQDEKSQEEWASGGVQHEASRQLHESVAYIISTVQTIAQSPPELKELESVYQEMQAKLESMRDQGFSADAMLGVFDIAIMGSKAFTEGAWPKAMKKAVELAEKKAWVEESASKIDVETPMKIAREIMQHCESERSRLEAAGEQIKASVEAGDSTEGGGEEGETGVF